jgi:hypothetical protein
MGTLATGSSTFRGPSTRGDEKSEGGRKKKSIKEEGVARLVMARGKHG